MKIADLVVKKEPLEDGKIGLVCRVVTDTGEEFASPVYWINPYGLWASDKAEREPAEIAAFLRGFARAIEQMPNQQPESQARATG